MTSETVRRIADKYTMKTADQVQRPKPKHPPEPPLVLPPQSAFWRTRKRDRFIEWDLYAIWVAGPRGPISPGIGHNRIRWPLLMGGTSSFADNVTKNAKRWWPYEPMGVWFRIWVRTPQHAQQLQFLVLEVLEHEQTPNPPWIDVDPYFNVGGRTTEQIEQALGLQPLPADAPTAKVRERGFRVARGKLEQFFVDVAERHGIEAYTDLGVGEELERWDQQEMARQVGDRSRG